MQCKYLKNQCQWRMCWLEHPSPLSFSTCGWQSKRSSLPLLTLRTILFVYSSGVLLTSVTLTPANHYKYWFLYFTSWGFLCVVFTTGFSTVISATRFCNGPIDATFGLPWYVKTYWVLYNITIPVAFLITAFYWGILRRGKNVNNYAPDPVLDVMLHASNSLVMLLELISSAHPSRLMHIMQPLYFALAYLLFTVFYYFVGGSDP